MEGKDATFRLATEQDYHGIKDLSEDIYGATDILLHSIFDWLKSDELFLFVGETEKCKIIAFTAVHLTDGAEGLNVRSSRVDKEYRGHGLYKDIVRYAVQYVRERVPNARCIYRLRTREVRVPDGYDIIKKKGLVKVLLDCDAKAVFEEFDVTQCSWRMVSWHEFKDLYDRNDAMKDLFLSATMEIHGDIFNLNCQANWEVLDKRLETRIMLTEYEGKDGTIEMMISLLTLGKFFTNDGVPMEAMNVYGTREDGLRCHIVKGLLEISKHVGRGKALMVVWMGSDILPACIELLKETPIGSINQMMEMNLLRGDFNRKLEGISVREIVENNL